MNSTLQTEQAPRPVTPREMANAIRALAMDAVEAAKSGHPGMPMGMADVATTLFRDVLKFDPREPTWPDRDRFVLSAGHGSMLLYALLHLTGYEGVTVEQLKQFRQFGAKTAGHPEFGHCPGVETTTGPLGQGIATAVGMAMAEAMLAERFGRDLVDHYTYVIAGDGCLMEGISHEAIDLAGHLKLGRLIVLWDDNRISIDGPTSLSTSMDQGKRFESAGWHVQAIDGHDHAQIATAIAAAKSVTDKPSLIACRTIIGFGAPNKQGSETTHGAPLGTDEIAAARAHLGWPHAPFEVPPAVRSAWLAAGERGAAARAAWTERYDRSAAKTAFDAHIRGDAGPALDAALAAYKKELAASAPKIATRKASEMVLGVINAATDLTVGGSADLTHSNLTVTKGLERIAPGKMGGRYIHFGIREHAMAAAMNGIALHGGFIPYGGTFLVFSDYARGAMRLSALMQQRVIYVMTHDSIGLGEDGPTHQPIEHLAMLRATPNINVLRPADAVETAECWQIALASRETPSVLALSRQNLPTLRTADTGDNLCSRGGYVLREAPGGKRDVTIIATGSEVEIAVAGLDILQQQWNISAAVVSLPCWELFERQTPEYQQSVLGTAPRIGVEAACGFGWERWIGDKGRFIGLNSFGASAPAPALYRHFGITAEAVASAARTMLR